MRNTSIALRNEPKRRIAAMIGFTTCLLLIAAHARLGRAQEPSTETFASAQQAASALYLAVRNDDQDALTRILGVGRELVSSEDAAQDRVERERFARKYREMHRLARERDGSEVLYVGGENWPFPFPLVAENGAWHFDTDAGMDQVLLRRIGEDETTAIATCLALVAPKDQTASASRAAVSNVGNDAVPFHGYYFRVIGGEQTSAALSTSAASETQSAASLKVVAYPAEYRVTGVMTFVVAGDGGLYEADLGPPTLPFAKQLNELDPTLAWQAVR